MRQRGRKSAANLASPVLSTEGSRLIPPASLNTEEQVLFAELVGAVDEKHFRISDQPLLISYIQATLMARRVAHEPANVSVWERACKLQAMLATRLRLSPQSRIDPKTVGRSQQFTGPKPWERDADEIGVQHDKRSEPSRRDT